MTDVFDEWLDDQMIADDPPSRRGWKQTARGGLATGRALTGVPRDGQILCRVPIEHWRIFRDHCRRLRISPGVFAREAIGARMVAEGIDRETISGFFTTRS